MSKILLYDSYDSFTFNLKHYLEESGAEVRVVRNDACSLSELIEGEFDGVVFSPGPRIPSESGNLMEVLAHFEQHLPILGVCLGHQAIGEHFGWELVKAQKPMHGKVSTIRVAQDELFTGCPESFEVCRYHSLLIQPKGETELIPLAWTSENEIMAVRHRDKPIWGVQYHPEAILTEHGHLVLRNWLKVVTLRG